MKHKTLAVWLTILVVIILGYLLAIITKNVPIPLANADVQVQTKSKDIERLIGLLAQCESHGNELSLNPHDPITPSYGLLQFKTDTFYRYNQKYKVLPDLEQKEVLNVIYDGEVQKELAYRIIEDGGWRNWTACLSPYFD